MAIKTPNQPNPNRVEAGRRNRKKRKGLTPAGREKLRQAALANQPWKHTKGPVAQVYVKEKFSVTKQVSDLLEAIERLTT